jgi:hypothetical protein
MSVFPAASGNFLPPTWRDLMSNPVSQVLFITKHQTYQRVRQFTYIVFHHFVGISDNRFLSNRF